jgi:hypothetical protein
MRYTALIVALIGCLLFTAVYGAITVLYSRLSRAGQPRRYLPETTSLYVHDVYIELPCGLRVMGDGQQTATLRMGFLR